MSGSPPGRFLGCDFAGTIEDPNGSHWKKGQRVAGFVHGASTNPLRGIYAEYATIEASLVFAIPDSVSYQDAAVIPLAFATAVQALFLRLRLPEPSKPAETPFPVLVYGATGSVGLYAVQLCKQAGLFVIATGSKNNFELLKSLGADATVDYNDADWPAQVRELTHGNLEHALDTIAEKGSSQQIARALSPARGGHIVTLLPITQIRPEIEAINAKARIESTLVYSVFEREYASPVLLTLFDNLRGENDSPTTPLDKAFWERWLVSLPDLLATGKLVPNKVREYGGLEDIRAGFKDQQDGKIRAEKIVYKIA